MPLEENSDENNHYYVDRRYICNARPRGLGGYKGRSFSRGDFQVNNGHNGRQQKKCFVCRKPKCWSTRHTPEERKQRRSDWRFYAQDMEINEDLKAFLVNYEGIDTEEYLDKDLDSKDFHAWLASTPDKSSSKQSDQFHTACGSINGRITTNLLNNQCVMHALTGTDPYDGKADGPSTLFYFPSRYDSDVFQGIMPDTGAAGISTAGKNQVKAVQEKLPSIELGTSTAGRYSVRFGDNPDTQSLGTVDVKIPFGMICFAVMPLNIPFLLCLSDMDKYGVYLNNVENVLVHEQKKYPTVRKWGHPWLFLEDLEGSMLWCHMIEAKVRQLYRRFGHPAVERLYKVLQRAGYNDLKAEAIAKSTKYCYQCQMHGGAPGRFLFTLHDDVKFNIRVVIDVMYINSRPVLHVVDEATSFQAARFLPNITAKTTWDTPRAMWIDMYVGPPDVIVTDAGKNLTALEIRANAHAMAVKDEEVPVESHNSIGKVERYHHTLKRAYEVISADLRTAVTSEDTLQMAVRAVNDTAGPQGLVPPLLVFGTYPRLTESSPPSPSITVRANAIRKAMTEARKLKATRQVAEELSMRNGPIIIDTIQLPPQSKAKVWRESIGWTGPHTFLARSNNYVTCTVDVNGKVINFRTVSVKPYHRDEDTVT
ncbi:hypothetical protein K3495_g10925 [Podosphaera aphanis]|nr:hypothetical protein K3495_g10925 [Podosphaera aphanis]